MSRIGIGIPIYDRLPPQTDTDYMRMMYHFGRRMTEHEFFLITRRKSEQFRARNAIVETALQFGMDYLLFLDDDHVINWKATPEHSQYDFLQKLLDHDKDIVGCLYFHRTGEYRPVLMKETGVCQYTFLTDDEITGGLQEVDVQGGGCMLINMKIFDKILPPYFEPEQQTGGKNLGTDIQLCKKAREAGFKVWCDTSIIIGHLKQDNEVVTHLNRDSFIADNVMRGHVSDEWVVESWIKSYLKDVRDYTGFSDQQILDHAKAYNESNFSRFENYENSDDYYKSLGVEQICRQALYHSRKDVIYEGVNILKHFKMGHKGYGIDFGCGSAPVGFEFLKLGHEVDFVDIDGTPAYEFLKWRVAEHKMKAGWSVRGPYDFALFLDVIEHLKDWQKHLDNVIGRMKHNAILVTNYFDNSDFENVEHVNMEKDKVMEFLLSRHMIPRTMTLWQKDDIYMGGAMNISTEDKK